MGTFKIGYGRLGRVEGRGRGTVAAKGPHPHMGIDGTDGGHLSSVYDWLRVTGNGGATLCSSRVPHASLATQKISPSP